MSVSASEDEPPITPERGFGRDLKVMGVIGVAHGTSHFFQLVLPPLFPFLIDEFEVSYTELGILMTTFFLASGIGQPIAGFLVDRVGARRVLLLGLGIYVVSILALSGAPSFWSMFPLVAIAALGNAVFHPADFTILNANVRPSFLGRAFGVHTLGGNLGWALAPVSMLLIAEFGGWRLALTSAAAFGAVVWIVVWWVRAELHDPIDDESETTHRSLGAAFLIQPAIVLCFSYFALLAAALIAVQNFLPTILHAMYATPQVLAGLVLTGFLLGAALGVLVGGFLADHSQRHSAIVMAGMAGSALLLVSVAHIDYAGTLLVVIVAGAGFLSGITTPSRDLLVRSATPPGATGRVFGVVYSGLDVGSALAPITVGWMLDHGHAQWAIWTVAAFILAGIATVASVPRREGTPSPASA